MTKKRKIVKKILKGNLDIKRLLFFFNFTKITQFNQSFNKLTLYNGSCIKENKQEKVEMEDIEDENDLVSHR
jgi:hypothetical protein